jgi:glycosyltransferase involved in cell wall biosynthesis
MASVTTSPANPPQLLLDHAASAPPERRIRVVFVIDNMRVGGTELNAVRTAERLDQERFDLSVVCLGEDGPLTERYRALGTTVENMPIDSFYGPSMLRSGRRFVRMLRRERVDIVHAHDVYSNIFSAVWARRGGVPVLITSRRWWSSLPNWKLQLGSRFAVSRSNAVLANSSAVASAVKAEAAADQQVWTITNFVDDDAFGTPGEEERGRLREEWNAPSGAVVIGCVARFDPVKDHAGLLRAFALLRARHPNAYLVLIGDGATRPALERLRAELDLTDAVHFAGEKRSRTNLHRGFDISVLASRSEGFPNSLVEAMAAGNPVVATAVGGSVDAVAHEETGLLVPAGRPDELASAMLRLAGDAGLRAAYGDAGVRRARERFGAANVVAGLEDMYSALLASCDR